MTPRQFTQSARSRWSITLCLIATIGGGCSTDLTVPAPSSERATGQSAAASPTRERKQRSWRGKGTGRLFTVDEATNELRDDRGNTRHLSARTIAQISETFDNFEKVDAFLATFKEKNPECKARADKWEKKGVHASFIQTTAAGSATRFGSMLPSSSRAELSNGMSMASIAAKPPVTLANDDIAWGPDYCTGIELAINSLTPQYESLQRAYENTVGTWQMDLVQWLVEIQQAWAFVTSARFQLEYLAYQYRAFGCFHQ